MGGRCQRCGPPGSGRAETGGDLRAILRAYRSASGLTQQQLADVLGFDRTYISMIECGCRSITDRGTLTHIARTLAIPAAHARVPFGVALGHLLPEERLATAARWTGRALRIAWDLGDRRLLAFVLRMHGNELREADRTGLGHATPKGFGLGASGLAARRWTRPNLAAISAQAADQGSLPLQQCHPRPRRAQPAAAQSAQWCSDA